MTDTPGHKTLSGRSIGLGRGVGQDYAEAKRWYRLAAEQGRGVAQVNLGLMYANGQGAPVDNVSALMWFTLAVMQETSETRERNLKLRDEVAARMSTDEIAEAERRAQAFRLAWGPIASALRDRLVESELFRHWHQSNRA